MNQQDDDSKKELQFTSRKYQAGEILFRQSEFGDTAYIIRSGRVGVYLEEEDDIVPVNSSKIIYKQLKEQNANVELFLYKGKHKIGIECLRKIRTIILDPARAGIAPKTLLKIIDINADRLVYVSCNPATQARDTETLQQYGYAIKKISLVDQFPHTSHIETVVLFEKQ